MSRTEADSRHLKVGDRLTFRVFGFDDFNTLFTEGAAALPTIGRAAPVTVVGIGEFQDSIAKAREGGQGVGQVFSRAFYEKYGSPSAGFWAALVRLKDPSTMASFRSGLDGLMASRPLDPAKMSGDDPPPAGTPSTRSTRSCTRPGTVWNGRCWHRPLRNRPHCWPSPLLPRRSPCSWSANRSGGGCRSTARDNATFDAWG